jgi:hypothetical protein
MLPSINLFPALNKTKQEHGIQETRRDDTHDRFFSVKGFGSTANWALTTL